MKQTASTTWYFALGAPWKNSLMEQYCRENSVLYLTHPPCSQVLQHPSTHIMLDGPLSLLSQLQPHNPHLTLLFVGDTFTPDELTIREEYQQIGRAVLIPTPNYDAFRKAVYPTLLILYGPNQQQIQTLYDQYFHSFKYEYLDAPIPANEMIAHKDKTVNYVINGMIADTNELTLLQHYFKLRVMHIKHDPAQYPAQAQYFAKEAPFLKTLITKPYFKSFESVEDIPQWVCPKVTFVQGDSPQLKQYLKTQNILLLSIYKIQSVLKRKPQPLFSDPLQKIRLIASIIYRDLSRDCLFLSDFPHTTQDFYMLQVVVRPLTRYIDLAPPTSLRKDYTAAMGYLERQLYSAPSLDFALSPQLEKQATYWIVSGAPCSGKTSVAKYISTLGYRLIEYQPYMAGAKEKLLGAGEEEVPLKTTIKHMQGILSKEGCVVDCAFIESDIAAWTKAVGTPNVINLRVDQAQLIKRTRRKAESDVNAEVTEEENTKAKEAVNKNTAWVNKLNECCPAARIFQIEYNRPLLLTEKHIEGVLRPHILLVTINNTLLYHNIALKYKIGFINLLSHSLKDCQQIIRAQPHRHFILCNYHPYLSPQLLSKDLHWIETNLGQVVYLGTFNEEECEVKRPALQPPKPEVPPPKPEGEQPTGDTEDNKNTKKKVDFTTMEWTDPKELQNLSQWFFQLKKNAVKRQHSFKLCFDSFKEVLSIVEEGGYVYESIKE